MCIDSCLVVLSAETPGIRPEGEWSVDLDGEREREGEERQWAEEVCRARGQRQRCSLQVTNPNLTSPHLSSIGVCRTFRRTLRNTAGQVSQQMIAYLKLEPGIRHSCVFLPLLNIHFSTTVKSIRHFDVEEK